MSADILIETIASRPSVLIADPDDVSALAGALPPEARPVAIPEGEGFRIEVEPEFGDVLVAAAADLDAARLAMFTKRAQNAIESLVDNVARSRGYSDGVSCASYAASTVPGWSKEASAFIAWRDAVWGKALADLAAARSGGEGAPRDVKAVLASLPAISWPEP